MSQHLPSFPNDYLGYGRMVALDPGVVQPGLPSPIEASTINAQIPGSYEPLLEMDTGAGHTLVSFVLEVVDNPANFKVQGSLDGNIWFDVTGYDQTETIYGSNVIAVNAGTGGNEAFVSFATGILSSFRFFRVMGESQGAGSFVNVWGFAK